MTSNQSYRILNLPITSRIDYLHKVRVLVLDGELIQLSLIYEHSHTTIIFLYTQN